MSGLLSSKFLLLCSFGIFAFQFLLSGVWFTSEIPNPDSVLPLNQDCIILTCNGESSPILIFLNLLLSMFFMVSSTVLAFKTRYFPSNYNESRNIAITLYVTSVTWALFISGYFFTSFRKIGLWKEYLTCILCVLIGCITLLGLFGPKLKLLLFTSKEKLVQKSNESQILTFSLHACQTNK